MRQVENWNFKVALQVLSFASGPEKQIKSLVKFICLPHTEVNVYILKYFYYIF
jgi:hypothetical protein